MVVSQTQIGNSNESTAFGGNNEIMMHNMMIEGNDNARRYYKMENPYLIPVSNR
jgi:hypothetical protein